MIRPALPVLCSFALALPAFAADGRILVTGDINGRVASLECEADNVVAHPGLAAIGVGREESVLLLDNGNLLGTDGFGRFLVARSADSARALGEVVADAGYDALVPGMRELATPRDRLQSYLDGLAAGGTRIVAANLGCAKSAQVACEKMAPSAVIEREGLRIGIVGLVAGDILTRLPPERARDWTVTDPQKALVAQMAVLADKADMVIVLAHVEGPGTAPNRTRSLAESITGWDVIVGNAFFDSTSQSHIRTLRLSKSPGAVVGTSRYSRSVTVLPFTREDSGVTLGVAEHLELSPETGRGHGVASRLGVWATQYCEEMNVAIGGAQFDKTWSEDDLRNYALGVMRDTTRSEVAMLNRDHLRVGDNVLSGAVTHNLMFRAFPFEDPIGTIELRGAALEGLLKKSSDLFHPAAPDRIAVVGAKKAGGSIEVNGRALDPAGTYRVATTAFIASGGDGYLPPRKDFEIWQPDPDQPAPVLRDLVIEWIEGGGDGRIGAADFPDLANQPLWNLSADAQVAFNDVSVDTIPQYDDSGQPQLSRAPATGQNYRGGFRARMDTRRIVWTSGLDLKYGRTRVVVPASPPDPQTTENSENTDEIRLNSVVRYNRWKARTLRPVPYAELDIESEFTTGNPHDDNADEFHHLLTTATGGVRTALIPKLEVFVGAGARQQLLDPDDSAKFGLQAGYRLEQVTLAQGDLLTVTFESQLDYFRAEPFAESVDRLLWVNKLNIQVFGYLTAGVALDAFAYREGVEDFATSTQLTFTVGAAWNARVQTH